MDEGAERPAARRPLEDDMKPLESVCSTWPAVLRELLELDQGLEQLHRDGVVGSDIT